MSSPAWIAWVLIRFLETSLLICRYPSEERSQPAERIIGIDYHRIRVIVRVVAPVPHVVKHIPVAGTESQVVLAVAEENDGAKSV
jgi:hypothetical protein